MASGATREATKIVRELERKGWRVERGRHYKCYPPNGGAFVTMSVSPGGSRGLKNAKAMLARAERGGYAAWMG